MYASVSVSVNESQSAAIPPVFRTPNADRPFKDEIVVEILSLDDKDFTGTITTSEARITIFEDVLGFKQDDLAGIKIGYNQGRIITYKLKQQFNINELHEWEKFSFERSCGKDIHEQTRRLRGIAV